MIRHLYTALTIRHICSTLIIRHISLKTRTLYQTLIRHLLHSTDIHAPLPSYEDQTLMLQYITTNIQTTLPSTDKQAPIHSTKIQMCSTPKTGNIFTALTIRHLA
jgi:hypothetical protein